MFKDILVRKKDLTLVEFNKEKILNAINKSSERVLVILTQEQIIQLFNNINEYINSIKKDNIVDILDMHNIVEKSLRSINKDVAKSYMDYRNYKTEFVQMLDEVYVEAQKISYLGDKENSNTDSALVATKRSLIYGHLNKELYKKFFLNVEEKSAINDGYIYIHDMSARRDTLNCCLFDSKAVMTGGFEMGNMWYNEPKSIDTACDVLGDIIMMSASMQYGE